MTEAELFDRPRKFCGHVPGLSYKGVALKCQLYEHTTGAHMCFVPPGDPDAAECVPWSAEGRLYQPIKYAKGQRVSATTLARPVTQTGYTCDNCGGSNMIRSGTCMTCGDCGTTTGCS